MSKQDTQLVEQVIDMVDPVAGDNRKYIKSYDVGHVGDANYIHYLWVPYDDPTQYTVGGHIIPNPTMASSTTCYNHTLGGSTNSYCNLAGSWRHRKTSFAPPGGLRGGTIEEEFNNVVELDSKPYKKEFMYVKIITKY